MAELDRMTLPDPPSAEDGALARALHRTLDDARRAYAAFRPEVALYLFDRGLRASADALPAGSDRDVLIDRLWRLQLESIGARTFGVSTDAWRTNPAYPDRYFPLVWLDLVPKILPLLPAHGRLPAVVALFNLGENLVLAAPSAAGLVAEAMLAETDAIAREGVESVALSAMVRLGVLPAPGPGEGPARGSSAAAWTRVVPLAVVSVAAWEPSLIPGAIEWTGDSTVRVADRTRPLALDLAVAGSSARLVGRERLAAVLDPSALPIGDEAGIAIAADGSVRHRGRAVGRVDPRGIAGVATSPRGLVAVARRFSQRVELHALLP